METEEQTPSQKAIAAEPRVADLAGQAQEQDRGAVGEGVADIPTLSAAQFRVLGDFARAVKAARRAVSMYPDEHPAVASALMQVTTVTARFDGPAERLEITVLPNRLLLNGRRPERTEAAVAELAQLLHRRAVGVIRIGPETDQADWRALLALLGRNEEELVAECGIAHIWAAASRPDVEIQEIDYEELLRERNNGSHIDWDTIVSWCMDGVGDSLDDALLEELRGLLKEPEQFETFLERVLELDEGQNLSPSEQATGIVTFLSACMQADRNDARAVAERLEQAAEKFTPEMVLAVLGQARKSSDEKTAQVAAIIEQTSESAMATFVAKNVAASGGRATLCLAQALEALVPNAEEKERVVERARQEASAGPQGSEAGIDEAWREISELLTSYSDTQFVSEEYDGELAIMQAEAMDVDRVLDDPPERVQDWLLTVSEDSILDFECSLLQDLLKREADSDEWREIGQVTVSGIDRRVAVGDLDGALALCTVLANGVTGGATDTLRQAAAQLMSQLAVGPMANNVLDSLRSPEEVDLDTVVALVRLFGASIVAPLTEALVSETHRRAAERATQVMLRLDGFGWESIDKLRHAANPAVRRTAVGMLKSLGGDRAIEELTSMIHDADPHVQRDAVRALLGAGTDETFSVLEAFLLRSPSHDDALRQMLALRGGELAPFFRYMLRGVEMPKRGVMALQAHMIEAMGSFGDNVVAIEVLSKALHRGSWLAPRRTKRLREAAAAALRRIGSVGALKVLEDAVQGGSAGVRKVAAAHVGATSRTGRGQS